MRITETKLRQLIREEATNALLEAAGVPVLYTGLVLDDITVEHLRAEIEELGYGRDVDGWQTSNIGSHGHEQLNHHMTIIPGALKSGNPLIDELGVDFPLWVHGWGVDPEHGVAAWQIRPPRDIPVQTGNPHITAALRDSSVKPFQASKIKNWTPLDRPFMLVGRLQEVTPISRL